MNEFIETPVDVINPYCAALDALRSKPAHELKEVGDQWCTPDAEFWGINARFGPFSLDLFADDHNAKCAAYYTAADNALTQDWSARLMELGGAAFANPPFSRERFINDVPQTGMNQIMKKAIAERELGGRFVFLIRATTSETWWPEQADHIAFIRGRFSFAAPAWYRPADKSQRPSSAGFAMAIAIFDKTWSGPRTSYITRDALRADGRVLLHQIESLVTARVNALTPHSGQ